jgi:DNA N-6-adenine-methyltransferase (Dam)
MPATSGSPLAQIRAKKRQIAQQRAGKAAGQIHAFDKAEEIAERVKDARALEGALIGKLENQRDFAAEYRALFSVGRPEKNYDSTVVISSAEWCLGFGSQVRTVQRWLELLDATIFAERKTAILKRCWDLAELWQAANFSSASVEWFTPAYCLEAVRDVLGEIELDPASSPEANSVVRATKIFTKKDDGLAREWFGRVFVNPPYGVIDGESLASAFCNKAVAEFASGNVIECIILVNSLHSQRWQAPLYDHLICFVDHRIKFVSGDGEENKNPTFQNVFVYLGDRKHRFAEVFSRLGYVMRKVDQTK